MNDSVTHGTSSGGGQSANNNVPRVIGRPFVKGQSGNPKGRPKGESLTDILKRVLNEEVQDVKLVQSIVGQQSSEIPITYKELLMRRWLERAIVSGANETIVAIVNRLEGTPRQTVEFNTTQNIRYDPTKYRYAQGLFENTGQPFPTDTVASFVDKDEVVDADEPLT